MNRLHPAVLLALLVLGGCGTPSRAPEPPKAQASAPAPGLVDVPAQSGPTVRGLDDLRPAGQLPAPAPQGASSARAAIIGFAERLAELPASADGADRGLAALVARSSGAARADALAARQAGLRGHKRPGELLTLSRRRGAFYVVLVYGDSRQACYELFRATATRTAAGWTVDRWQELR